MVARHNGGDSEEIEQVSHQSLKKGRIRQKRLLARIHLRLRRLKSPFGNSLNFVSDRLRKLIVPRTQGDSHDLMGPLLKTHSYGKGTELRGWH